MNYMRTWQPTPVFLPGKYHGQRSLVGYSPLDHKESDTTEQLSTMNNSNNFRNVVLLSDWFFFFRILFWLGLLGGPGLAF